MPKFGYISLCLMNLCPNFYLYKLYKLYFAIFHCAWGTYAQFFFYISYIMVNLCPNFDKLHCAWGTYAQFFFQISFCDESMPKFS